MRQFINIINENQQAGDTTLDMSDKARMDRAKAMGFNVVAYHGTAAKFKEFDVEKGNTSVMGGHAPHFSAKKGEAMGYKKEAGKGGKVLHCLLRTKKPLVVDLMGGGKISRDEYKKLTGVEWESDKWEPTGYKVIQKLEDQIGYSIGHRALWNKIYRVLDANGYDSLHYANVFGDYTDGKYDKYVVFDPKNIRLINAAFDPSKSNSSDLLA